MILMVRTQKSGSANTQNTGQQARNPTDMIICICVGSIKRVIPSLFGRGRLDVPAEGLCGDATVAGLSQADLQHQADQAHISRLEAATTTPTIDLSADLAHALGLTPLSLLTLVAAADEGKTARSVLNESMIELMRLGVLDEALPGEPQKITTPQRIAAAERLEAVRKLKAEGLSQAEVCRHLELPRSTVGRLWHVDD